MSQRHPLRLVHVLRSPLDRRRGWVIAGPLRLPCALGRSGVTMAASKREGDGTTPAGRYRPLRVYYRPDRGRRPRTLLPVRALSPSDGWCDDPRHRLYNRPVRLPFAAGHERMWREDGLYDVVIEIDHNTRPRVRGRGSAVFLHMSKPKARPAASMPGTAVEAVRPSAKHADARLAPGGPAPTEGCVAIAPRMMRRFLALLGPDTVIVIR